MKKKHLNFYNASMILGVMPAKSLAHAAECLLIDFELLNDFFTGAKSLNLNISEWVDIMDTIYNTSYEFTPLRRNIVLFMAAMNNEL